MYKRGRDFRFFRPLFAGYSGARQGDRNIMAIGRAEILDIARAINYNRSR